MSATSSALTNGVPARPPEEDPFWQTTALEDMTPEQWESLCDGCGKCCLHKIQDEDEKGRPTEVLYTSVACRLLDLKTCQCSDYANRWDFVPDCVQLYAGALARLDWLPSSCAYRLLYEGKDLPEWHPLVSGDPTTVHKAGMSVRGRCISERKARSLEHYLVDWPDL